MELTEMIVTGLLWLLYAAGGIVGIMFVSYMGTLIYDEFKANSNDLYELLLTLAVGIEFLFRGRPKDPKKVSRRQYKGRHHIAAVKFIDELVVEMRVRPGSLCYDEKLAVSSRV